VQARRRDELVRVVELVGADRRTRASADGEVEYGEDAEHADDDGRQAQR
jgi:hypothetical protein